MSSHFLDIEKLLCKQKPFVAFKNPNEQRISVFYQKESTLHTFENSKQEGFVMASFLPKSTAYLIPNTNTFCFDLKSKNQAIHPNHKLAAFNPKNHYGMVEKAIEAIKNGAFKKVVLSSAINIKTKKKEVSIFKDLLFRYPTAFVYLWFHPKMGLWLGAPPETLLSLQGNQFSTMALAGTQKKQTPIPPTWEIKEIEEQAIVTQYISDLLKEIAKFKIDKPKTVSAATLWHLQTTISGTLFPDISADTLIKKLHPTPAVCGLPMQPALDFILKNENYQREFYTGYLGEISKEKSRLFVNLRCMQLKTGVATIYVGGGITQDSNPSSEIQEIINKSATMASVI